MTLAKVFSSAYLKRTIFCVCLYFVGIYFWEWQVLKISSFKISAPKKKTGELRDIRLMFLSRSTEKQAGHDWYWFIIDLLLIDSKNLAELILCIFSVNLFSQMPFKRKFCVYLILWNRSKFATNITLKVDIIRIAIWWPYQKLRKCF